MCDREGWEVVGEGSDENFSAYSGNRGPELERTLLLAGEVAADSGEVVAFVVQHSDRISRGAGDAPGAPKALIEIWHEQRRRDVHLRSVQDDDDLRSSSSVANLGERNHIDSKRKSAAVKDGIKRAVADQRWRGGILTAGYAIKREVDERGEVTQRVVKHPDDEWIYDLIWRLAEDGASMARIAVNSTDAGPRPGRCAQRSARGRARASSTSRARSRPTECSTSSPTSSTRATRWAAASASRGTGPPTWTSRPSSGSRSSATLGVARSGSAVAHPRATC